jgi:hypothetical protein
MQAGVSCTHVGPLMKSVVLCISNLRLESLDGNDESSNGQVGISEQRQPEANHLALRAVFSSAHLVVSLESAHSSPLKYCLSYALSCANNFAIST